MFFNFQARLGLTRTVGLFPRSMMLSSAKPRLSIRLPSLTRTYASRLPQRPPARGPDPLVNNPHATYESLPGDLTFIHRPPPTAPTPESFTTLPSSPLLRPPTATSSISLPPELFPDSRAQPPRMSQEDIQQMKMLRKSDKATWTVAKLAEEFGCTPTFVKLMAPLTPAQRKKKLTAREEEHA